jgi:hypothetical protein
MMKNKYLLCVFGVRPWVTLRKCHSGSQFCQDSNQWLKEQNSGPNKMKKTSCLAQYPIRSFTRRNPQNQFIKDLIQRVSYIWGYTLQYTTYGPYSLEVLLMNTNKYANKIHHIYHTIYLSSSIQGQVTRQLRAAGNERSTQAIRQSSPCNVRHYNILQVRSFCNTIQPELLKTSL